MEVSHRLALVIRAPDVDEKFLVVKQIPPAMPPGERYAAYADSDLWDLPSVMLNALEAPQESSFGPELADDCDPSVDLRKFDLHSAINQVLTSIGMEKSNFQRWMFLKYIKEPDFGPDSCVHTVFVHGKLTYDYSISSVGHRWMNSKKAKRLLVHVESRDDRLGPLVVAGAIDYSHAFTKLKFNSSFLYQEYPPGIISLPMGSRTPRPFNTTNLVVVSPDNVSVNSSSSSFSVSGDALIVDPGCQSALHSLLAEIVSALPRKLLVFVTHHHRDHVDGLSVIWRCNPDAILLAHENTMFRIGKDLWPLSYVPVYGDENLSVGGDELQVIYAPGHTDGHMALLHTSTKLLIVGDHCVGRGSAFLDISSGGNMRDYLQTTYKFLEVQPHAIMPMHGRINHWPMQMLCSSLKQRRDREYTILKVILDGAETLYDIVSKCYTNVDPMLWLFASYNVRVHVDHLADQGDLPKEFSLVKFRASCRLRFFIPFVWSLVRRKITSINLIPILIVILAVAISALAFTR